MKQILIAEDDRTTRLRLQSILKSAGFAVVTSADGEAALKKLAKKRADLLLTDIWMPRMNGLELLAHLREQPSPPRAIVMTSDSTPGTLLRAVREQAYQYVNKPVDSEELVEIVRDALADHPAAPPIEVVSGRPEWVELLVPCDLAVAERITEFMRQLKSDLPEDLRERIGQAFRELLINAVEWGGRLDPNQKVSISCLRTPRMLLYRIADPGAGFRFENLKHAAVADPPERPWQHVGVREEMGMRPGGFGLLMVRSLVDELIFNEAQNDVVFVKYLQN
ncbi:MAG TPA: response regulator [Candidatus Acidoferrales bacterium]|nr:response regulator [Candidatus Acidoferrales bacterium]